MAATLTTNLSLRISSEMTDDVSFNFQKIDELGSIFQVSREGTAYLRSQTDIVIEPSSPSLGGNGSGGNVSVGSSENAMDTFNVHASAVDFNGATIANLDVAWADITDFTSSTLSDILDRSHLLLTDVGTYDHDTIDSHIDTTSAHGVVGDVVGTTDAQSLTGKTIDASLNTLTEISNTSVAAAAAISGTKIAPNFGNQEVITSLGFAWQETFKTSLIAAQSGQAGNLSWTLPPADGTNAQVLSTNGAGQLSWSSAAGGATYSEAFTWPQADPDTKVITHNFNTKNVVVTILDENHKTISIDEEFRSSVNDIQLIRTGTIGGDWTVLLTNTGI